jgi:hypothetical protein
MLPNTYSLGSSEKPSQLVRLCLEWSGEEPAYKDQLLVAENQSPVSRAYTGDWLHWSDAELRLAVP